MKMMLISTKAPLCRKRNIISYARLPHWRRMMGNSKNQDSLQSTMTSFSIGSLAGLLGSLVGMGGGFVMIPLMTSNLLRLSQHTAHGTSLFAVTATGIAGALGYGLKDVAEMDSAFALAAGAMITARIGASYSSKISERTLKKSLGIFMLCVAPIVPAKSYISQRYEKDASSEVKKEGRDIRQDGSDTMKRLIPFTMIGLGSGLATGIYGVGGGAIVVPALTVFTNMTHHEALGTSLLAMALPAVVGTLTHYQKGNVALRVAIPLSVGAFVGAFAGGKLGLNISEDKLRYGFSSIMVGMGLRTLLKA